MIAVKLSNKVMSSVPECCDDCYYCGTKPHPYKGWTEECELCSQCLDDDQEDGWVYDGNSRPKNCPLVEIPEPYKPKDMNTEKNRRRGRPKADYTCAISKRVCPFNDDDVWKWGLARDVASSNCPIQSYENNDHIDANGGMVIDDWCKHLIPRNSD